MIAAAMPNAQKQAAAKLHQVNKTDGGMLWPYFIWRSERAFSSLGPP
jgi:hypothetical protein